MTGTAVGAITFKRISYSVADVHTAAEALDRAWQNANISEAARKDIELALKVLQGGKLLPEFGEVAS